MSATETPEIPQLPDGIYFNLPEEIYFAQHRFSASGAKAMMQSPADFWANSWLNPTPKEMTPDEEKRKAKSRFMGSAYHCAILEPQRFSDVYVREIDVEDFAGHDKIVRTGTELSAALADLGQPKTKAGEKVYEQALRLAAAGFDGVIYPLEVEKWKEANAGKLAIPRTDFDNLTVDAARVLSNPQIADILSGGISEVSVLWTDERGIKCQSRIDKLKPHYFVDLKTFGGGRGKNVLMTISDAVRYERYYLQLAFYWQAVEQVRTGELKCFDWWAESAQAGPPTAPELELVKAVRAQPEPLDPWLVFQQTGGVPNVFARRLRVWTIRVNDAVNMGGLSDEKRAEVEKQVRVHTQIFAKGLGEVAEAKRQFINHNEIYAKGEEWFPINAVGILDDLDFNEYWLEGR